MVSQLEQLQQQQQQLQQDLVRSRIKVSEACADLVAFCAKVDDPFDPACTQPNPFKVKAGGVCTIL
ncbi:guanine nucleotide-binding protein subunit gamma [Planoprotostelium fungivorum]|uniref:Guanine nucleotide-binding protein subunit gamma n=1 Tax=Planoprotostelium fungivorum TaxID=1890364 RepID=A0A2P6N7I9_9EUKA|nr:guanine nucleotide-binding protein subunit gamma [Planoprotostelium fungivorum]